MTYNGDFKLHQMPSTFDEAIAVYKDLPNKLGQNFENAIPQEIILFPLELIPEPKGKNQSLRKGKAGHQLSMILPFLVAYMRLFKSLCRSVARLVGQTVGPPSLFGQRPRRGRCPIQQGRFCAYVRPSVRPSVRSVRPARILGPKTRLLRPQAKFLGSPARLLGLSTKLLGLPAMLLGLQTRLL